MTPEKELELCENVATLVANIGSLSEKLDAHTEADHNNFEQMKTSIEKVQSQLDSMVKDKLDAVVIQLAEQRGAAKNRAILWSLVTSGALFSVLEFAKSMFK